MNINRRVKNILESTTLAITAKAKELKAKGIDVVNFAAGEPDFDTPDFIKKSAIEAIQKGFTKYTPSTGTVELREAICRKFKNDNNLEYKPSQIVVSCGAKHCIYDLIQVLVDDNEEVIIPAPYWVSYPEMVKLAGGMSKIIQTDANGHFKITALQLKKAISKKTKVLILNSPSNPTGMVYSKEELSALAEVCVENNIYVISDEIYEKLIYTDEPYVSMAALNKEIGKLTATVNGVSKAYAMTGWRIGYLAAEQEIVNYIRKFKDHTTSNPASISQVAALAALSASEESIRAMKEEFEKRRNLMMSCLDKISEISYIPPQGAFYVFCNISRLKMGSAAFAEKILNDVNVALIPGDGFGADDYIRLSFATSTERIQEGIKRIGGWVKRSSKGQ